jgi:hypothetical protein
VNVRNIPSTAAVNIPMHGNISSSCPRDRSDNVMTNSTAHFPMGVSHENAFTLPLVRCTTSVVNCNHTWSAGPSMQVTGNKTNGDYGNLRNIQMNQVQRVDSTTQTKVIDTSAQGSRDGLSDLMGDIIIPQADRTSELVHIAPQQPSTVPSFHAQCSNVGSQNDTPSQIDRAGKLQALKVLERAAPMIKFSGKINEMNFERFMERMEKNMEGEEHGGRRSDRRVEMGKY